MPKPAQAEEAGEVEGFQNPSCTPCASLGTLTNTNVYSFSTTASSYGLLQSDPGHQRSLTAPFLQLLTTYNGSQSLYTSIWIFLGLCISILATHTQRSHTF